MISDHFSSSEERSGVRTQVASLFAVGQVLHNIMEAIRLGRLTALQKADGGVRGIVVGDIFRRSVVRTMAKQISRRVEVATDPFHYALKTKAGHRPSEWMWRTFMEKRKSGTEGFQSRVQ